MAQDFMAALEAEIASLEAELSADLRYARLQQLRKVLALYTNPSDQAKHPHASIDHVINSGIIQSSNIRSGQTINSSVKAAIASTSGRRASVEKTQALEAVALHLSNRSGPVPTRDLLDHLNDLGLEIGGASPLNNLSAMLSNSERFISHGRSGWTLQVEKTNDNAHIEAMDKIAFDFAESLPDENLLKIKTQIAENNISAEVIDKLKNDYFDIMGKDYVGDGRNLFKKALEWHINTQIENRSAAFAE